MMRLVDTHCHLYWADFAPDRDAVLERARQAGVEAILQAATNVETTRAAVELAEAHPKALWAMAAIHPSEAPKTSEEDLARIAELARHPRVVAIGESGLDYHWGRAFAAQQEAFFREHIRLALTLDKPLVIHNRQAHEDLLRILRQEARSGLRGVLHCFSGDEAFAREAIRLGFLLGIGGVLTFKNSSLARVVRAVGLEHLVLETDAPFLAPVPYRGKRNEPAYLVPICARLAEVLEQPISTVAHRTSENARRLFGLPPLDLAASAAAT
ncbi:MAG: TatD family hydrolase [Bacteroidota bacterium]|nr:TatD family hydrolase [Bacteroidota bacterium]MDW8138095.1 TatD family hydrolase [Bacteroidota bacterium]